MRLPLLLLFLFGFLFMVRAQDPEPVVSQFNSWFMYFGNHRISDKWSIHTEYQWRRAEGIKAWQQSLARVGADVRTGEHVMLTAGYGYIISYPYGEQPIPFTVDEHRLWQQLILTQTAGRFHIQHRYRLEQRWVGQKEAGAGGEPVSTGRRYLNRARYRFFVAIPFNQPRMGKGAWFLALYDEVFLGFGKNVSKKNILDQNRAYAALGHQFADNANLQAGYLYHQVFKPDGVRRENNHTLQLALTYNFDLRK